MKKLLILLVLGLVLVSGCTETLKENTTTNQKSINYSCIQDSECEAVFSSCGCRYTGCAKKTDEPKTDCARFCSENELGPKPDCRCVSGECRIIKPEQPAVKLKICPEKWVSNQMPSSLIDVNGTDVSNEGRDSIIVNGSVRDASEFDIEWIKQNCKVNQPSVLH